MLVQDNRTCKIGCLNLNENLFKSKELYFYFVLKQYIIINVYFLTFMYDVVSSEIIFKMIGLFVALYIIIIKYTYFIV